MAKFRFFLQRGSHGPRAGVMDFHNYQVETPVFMPVGTAGAVKAMLSEQLEEIGYRILLANTYHLYLRPGSEVMKHLGGLHKFMNWPYAILTDSGGFQAFSLSKLRQYHPEGILFRSHLDGSTHFFTPQLVLEVQKNLKSDIVMPLDDCAEYPATEERLKKALDRTHHWLAQSVQFFFENQMQEEQTLFAIVQGGVNLEFRLKSLDFVKKFDLQGYAIGGLSVGEKNEEFLETLRFTCRHLPIEKPRYLMGVGSLPEILEAVAAGVDMFDCVLPTRNARNGQVFTFAGKVNLRNEKYKNIDRPIDENCGCFVCQRYSLAYLRHLHKSKEITAYILATYHNLYFMFQFMKKIRQAILSDNFSEFKETFLKNYLSKIPIS